MSPEKLEYLFKFFPKPSKYLLFFQLYLLFRAEANKVGEARQEPNHSPFLPPPVGRLSFSLNPWKMFN